MSKYELSMSKNYVLDWNIQDALREFAQNAIDHEKLLDDNKMSIEYLENIKQLKISNKNSVLHKKSLLLGATTKAEDKKTIGYFGEGYKVALLVLTRLNKKVTIYNCSKKEIWSSRFVKSRRYEDDILTISISKKISWDNMPRHGLIITIDDISKDDYNEFTDRTLQLQNVGEVLEGDRGRILLNPVYEGKIFVNGLYISTQSILRYGYDIKPQYLSIGRDRNLINSFDIQNETSCMWREHNSDMLTDLIMNSCPDVKYLNSSIKFDNNKEYLKSSTELNDIRRKIYNDLKVSAGCKDIIVVSSQKEYDAVYTKYECVKPVIAEESVKELVGYCDEYITDKSKLKKRTLPSNIKYRMWRDKNSKWLPNDELAELDSILEALTNENYRDNNTEELFF